MCIENSETRICGQALADHPCPRLCEKNKYQILWSLADLQIDPENLDRLLAPDAHIARHGVLSRYTLTDELLVKTYCAAAAKSAHFGDGVTKAVVQAARTCMEWAVEIHAVEKNAEGQYTWDGQLRSCKHLSAVWDWLYKHGHIARPKTGVDRQARHAKLERYSRLLRAFAAGPLPAADEKTLCDLGVEIRETST